MVSDFIDEHSGYLHLMEEEYEHAKEKDSTIHKYARQLLEYGEVREGYWTSENFVTQLKEASKIAEAKYPTGKLCEYSTTAVVMLPCPTMPWMCQK